MAAYAAAVSLMHILHQLRDHPSPPISLDKQQFDSLTATVTFLQEFLEGYVSPFSYSNEANPLEMRIADAVYAVEDVIESHIVDTIHLSAVSTAQNDDDDDDDDDSDVDHGNDDNDKEREGDYDYDDDDDDDDAMESYTLDTIQLAAASTTQDDDDDDGMESYTVDSIQLAAAATHHEDEQIRYINFYVGLEKVIEAMDLIKEEAMEMETDMNKRKGGHKAELQKKVSKSNSIESKIEMVGFEDELLKLKERLVGGDSNRQIIPIVGMGGIGKTTLARNVFSHQLIKDHFDICMWATVSQYYNIEQTLREVLSQGMGHPSGEKSVAELGEELYKCLFGRRYLVVMDDMWSIEAWDKIRNFFPDSAIQRINMGHFLKEKKNTNTGPKS